MGYSITLSAVYKVQKYLDILRTTNQSTIRWPTHKNTQTLVYQLHRAFASAEELSVPGYEKLRGTWELKSGKGYIEAVRRVKPVPETEINDVADALDVISVLTENKDIGPISFPLIPDVEDLIKWANENGVSVNTTKTRIIATWKVKDETT